MPRTKKPGANKRTITTMRLPNDLLALLDTRAKKEGRSRSNLVELLLSDGVKRKTVAGVFS